MSDQHPASANGDGPQLGNGLPPSSLKSFLLSRWRGAAPLETVFWRDMVFAGTLLNIAAAAGAKLLTASAASPELAWLCNYAPLPANLFLFFSVWRSTDQVQAENPHLTRIGASLWFLAMTARWAF